MTEIRVLRTLQEKEETRALYETVFPEDSARFLDWYYHDRCRDNVIVALYKDGQVVAMAHLNPFMMRTKKGTCARVYYIYAVATAMEERHQGYMAAVLRKSVQLMEEEHTPFCFLLPVDEAIYQPFDFHTVCIFQKKKNTDYTAVQKEYDVYIEENDDYVRRVKVQQAIAEEEGVSEEEDIGLPQNPVIMARILSLPDFLRFSGLPEDTNRAQAIDWLRQQRIYIAEEV